MIQLTESAAGKVKELLAEEGRADIALRVAVQPGRMLRAPLRDVPGRPAQREGRGRGAVRRQGRHRQDERPVPCGGEGRLRRLARGLGVHDRQPGRARAPAPAATRSTNSSARPRGFETHTASSAAAMPSRKLLQILVADDQRAARSGALRSPSARVRTPLSRQAAGKPAGQAGILRDRVARRAAPPPARRPPLVPPRRGRARRAARGPRRARPRARAPASGRPRVRGCRGSRARPRRRRRVPSTCTRGATCRRRLPEGLGDPRRGEHRAHRQVAARDALRARDEVGLEVPDGVLANQSPVRPKPGDHLVGDEEHAGLAADRADLAEVAVRRARTRRRRRSPARRRTRRRARGRPAAIASRSASAESHATFTTSPTSVP